ncbi:MAG: 4Fe-4S binding protein [Desulfovibrionaceae bacterium]|nr:4Fe-4S binding protein [Desulfovibrionaceae bacterium]
MRRVTIWRRLVQGASLTVFCLILCQAGASGVLTTAGSFFLSLDPLAGLAVPLSTKAWIAALWPVLLVYVSAIVFGRVFCGWICPMGATLDAVGPIARLGHKTKQRAARRPRLVKYLVLATVILAAIFGVNMAYWASPLPLTARLYGLVLLPLAEGAIDSVLPQLTVFAEFWGSDALRYVEIETHAFATAWFVALFWAGCLALERITPRFWCRYLCPAGALLGLLAHWALWRRRADSCVGCGACAQSCPSGICRDMAAHTQVSECLACFNCVQHCPHGAVRFGFAGTAQAKPSLLPSRRAFCGILTFGTVAGFAAQAAGEECRPALRPPGSVPENKFLDLCLRCGACLRACPTGGLQALWLENGFAAMFSPRLDPRSGPCRPECTACGQICPSKAILPLSPKEKPYIKIGTAAIDRTICLAWAENKRCMVCKENCPYDAIDVEVQDGRAAPVPHIHPDRCYGCGYCEKYCPTPHPAVRVAPQGAVRPESQESIAKVTARGETIHGPKKMEPSSSIPTGAPPGFLE